MQVLQKLALKLQTTDITITLLSSNVVWYPVAKMHSLKVILLTNTLSQEKRIKMRFK